MPKLFVYRIVWLIGAVLVLISLVLPYVYDSNLIATIGALTSKVPGAFTNPLQSNVAAVFSLIGFILLVLGGILCLIYAIGAYDRSRLWKAPRGIRTWNAAVLGVVGMVFFSIPVLEYVDGRLATITAFIGAQYSPVIEGFSIGYFLSWVGVVVSLIGGSLVLINKPPTNKNTPIANAQVA
jgi:hypothetical protein